MAGRIFARIASVVVASLTTAAQAQDRPAQVPQNASELRRNRSTCWRFQVSISKPPWGGPR
jgi:hypothetical protein